MKMFLRKFGVRLLNLSSFMRYFVIALLLHLGLVGMLASLKLAIAVPHLLARFQQVCLPPSPAVKTEPDPLAAYRNFEYNGSSRGGGGGPLGRTPGGLPTAANPHYPAPAFPSYPPHLDTVFGLPSDIATAARLQVSSSGLFALSTLGANREKGGGGGFAQRTGPLRAQILGKYQRGRDT